MSIKFDITDVLPTADAINGERSRLEGRLRRVTRLGWAVIGLLVLLDAVLWWEWSQGSWANDWLLLAAVTAVSVIFACIAGAAVGAGPALGGAGLFFLFGLLVTGFDDAASLAVVFGAGSAVVLVLALVAAAVAADWWSESRSRLRDALAQLDPAPREACTHIAGWSEQNPAVDAYRAAVVNQGRQITCGEFLSMKDWVESATARHDTDVKQKKIEAACREVYGMKG